MKKQFTVKEKNEWENETFNYVLLITPKEAILIQEKINELEFEEEISISETNYTNEDIKKINNTSNNCYMDFIAPYKLQENAIIDWEDRGDLFYKGSGMNRLKELETT